MQFYSILLIIYLTIKKSQQYEMELITRTPPISNETSLPSLAATKDIVQEFEFRRSPTLQLINVKLALEDVVDLCEAVDKDDSTLTETDEKKLYYYIPVTPRSGNGVPRFTAPCYGWKRKLCIGLPKPPFDYRCSFWMPFVHYGGDTCKEKQSRRKRMTRPFATTTVSGFEAITLCATAALIENKLSPRVDVKAVALPTNEGSDLRCINWILRPEGGWTKTALDKASCALLNQRRPGAYKDNELDSEKGIIEDMFSDVVKCLSTEMRVDCIFQRKLGVLYTKV